jgi:hypothetical protein
MRSLGFPILPYLFEVGGGYVFRIPVPYSSAAEEDDRTEDGEDSNYT